MDMEIAKNGVPLLAWFPHRGEWQQVIWDVPVYGDSETWCIENHDGERWSAITHNGQPTHFTPMPQAPE